MSVLVDRNQVFDVIGRCVEMDTLVERRAIGIHGHDATIEIEDHDVGDVILFIDDGVRGDDIRAVAGHAVDVGLIRHEWLKQRSVKC